MRALDVIYNPAYTYLQISTENHPSLPINVHGSCTKNIYNKFNDGIHERIFSDFSPSLCGH